MWNQKPFHMVDPLARKTGKYRNVRQSYDGYTYDSKLEAQYAMWLDSEKQAGRIVDWERQVGVDLDVNGHHICRYKVDFKVYHTDDTIEWVEVKGFQTRDWVLKRRLFEAAYLDDKPLERYTVVTK